MDDKNDFEGWLMFMDDAIEQGKLEILPSDISSNLDFSISSLAILEEWLLTNYSSTEEFMTKADNFVIDRLSRYVGETIRRNSRKNSVEWDIDLENEENAYYGLPVLKGPKWVECPSSLVTASMDRRTGSYLTKIANTLVSET